jgi:SAM-dependent methyltransferase
MPALTGLRRRLPLAVRADAPELLDGDSLSPAEIQANLADLARLNRLPGGRAASMQAIATLLDATSDPRILDLGTGGADLLLSFARRGWHSVGLDHNAQVLDVARRTTAGEGRIELIEGDGRSLPFPDDAVDVAHCSLLMHHLAPSDAVAVLREMQRVARRGVVVNDLHRGPLAFVATLAPTLALSRSRVTRHDGLASARRAYTLDELDSLLADAGLATAWRSSRWLPRVATAATPRS